MTTTTSAFSVQNLDFYYSASKALSNINIEIEPRKVTALIGPSGCGKSTFLRCLNRMNDTITGTRVDGTILLKGENIYALQLHNFVKAIRGEISLSTNPDDAVNNMRVIDAIYETAGLKLRGT